ncbi:MAG: ABC transporter permease subunit [Halobacteriovoraceae bacterium]|jgi:ABC-type transport system involved in multi-copper enzyme maturation permease subunit|nr:ABC transporter permease subunit [Halobacteriovoraceae bacterium]MBT5095234.1 ABC transporter permease subunit [Halobacteriovoraceae bacterium]
MSLEKPYLIFTNTLQKEFRNKMLLFILAFTVAVILGANVVINLLNDKVVTDFGMKDMAIGDKAMIGFYWFINLWSVGLAVLLGSNCTKSDFENHVIPQLLSFPIRRIEYLLARIFGTWFMVMGYYLFSIVLAMVSFSLTSGTLVKGGAFFGAVLINSFAILPIIILAVLFSFFTPKLVTFIGVGMLYLLMSISAGNLHPLPFSEMLNDLSFMKIVALGLYFFLPHSSILDRFSSATLFDTPFEVNILFEVGHYALTMALLILIATWVFRRRDL